MGRAIIAAFFAVLTVPTAVSGAYRISSDEYWSTADSPYIFTEDVIIERDASLTIKPGTVVLFGRVDPGLRGEEPGCRLDVRGTLIVAGDTDSTVIIEGRDGEVGDWGGIRFAKSASDASIDQYGRYLSGSLISCCEIRHAGDSAISTEMASPYLRDVRFVLNEARYDKGEEIVVDPGQLPNERIMGGAVYFYRPRKPVCVVRCEFSQNRSFHVGGAAAVAESYEIPVYFNGCRFIDNAAGERGGGAARLLGSSARFIACTFEENEAERGGAIHTSYGTDLVLESSCFSFNSARKLGGALFIAHESVALIEDCEFEGNAVNIDSYLGGGAVCIHTNGHIDFEGCSFTGNIASTGGAMLLMHKEENDSRPVSATCCSFIGNTAVTKYCPQAIESVDWNHLVITESTFGNACSGGYEVRVGAGVFEGRTNHSADFRGNFWQFGCSSDLVHTRSWDPGIDEPEVITGGDLETPPSCTAFLYLSDRPHF